MNSTDIISGFRKALQDVLVPEIKVLQMEIKHLNEKIDHNQQEANKRFDAMEKRFEQMDKRFEAIQKEMNARFLRIDEKLGKMHITQEKILDKLDVDKRMTRLETLVEQFMKKAA